MMMPIISVKLGNGRTIEQKQQYVEALTKETMDILKVPKDSVTIIFEEYDNQNWAYNGDLLIKKDTN